MAIEEAAKRGRTNTALTAMEGQRRARASLASERNEAAGTLAALRAERASLAAKGKQIETEAAPIRQNYSGPRPTANAPSDGLSL